MKKFISIVCFILLMLSVMLTALAGSIPEDLMYEDYAKIFFAEVTSYRNDGENLEIEFLPVKKIKGDVETGTKQIAYRPNTVGDFEVKVGNVYLFTYFDENNPTDIFETTTQDTKTLKFKNTTGDMWMRFEEYLNDGKYEEAELKRTRKLTNIQKIKNARVLSDMFIFDRDETEKIEVVYPGDGDPYGCYVDKDKFFDIADTIKLVPKNRIEKQEGVFIIAIDENDKRTSVWLDEKGRVGCTQYEDSSAVITQFDISKSDYIKLYAFLPEEATKHMPLENPLEKYSVIIIGISVLVFAAAFAAGFALKKKRG